MLSYSKALSVAICLGALVSKGLALTGLTVTAAGISGTPTNDGSSATAGYSYYNYQDTNSATAYVSVGNYCSSSQLLYTNWIAYTPAATWNLAWGGTIPNGYTGVRVNIPFTVVVTATGSCTVANAIYGMADCTSWYPQDWANDFQYASAANNYGSSGYNYNVTRLSGTVHVTLTNDGTGTWRANLVTGSGIFLDGGFAIKAGVHASMGRALTYSEWQDGDDYNGSSATTKQVVNLNLATASLTYLP